MQAGIGKSIGTALALVMALCATAAAQQKYPSRNIDLIIPFAVGGGVDLIARAMGASLGEQLGQTVVAVNRDGAAGTLGFTQLAGAAPDGMCWLSAPRRRSPMRRI